MSDSLQPQGLQDGRLPFPSTHVHRVGDAFQPSHPLSSPSPPDFNLSQHQIFSNESVLCIRWPKYWSFSFSISPSNENSGLISFRMDWFDILAVQGTLRVFSNITIQKHQFFGTRLLSLRSNCHIHFSTGKITTLTTQTSFGKVMSLLLNTLSRFVIAFLPRRKHLLIS